MNFFFCQIAAAIIFRSIASLLQSNTEFTKQCVSNILKVLLSKNKGIYYSVFLRCLNALLLNSRSNYTYFSRLYKYYEQSSGVSWGEAVFFSFGVVFCSMINVMVQHPFMMGVMHIGMKMRVGVCSLIYRKV